MQYPCPAGRDAALRLEAGAGRRQHHWARTRRSDIEPGTGRPVRALWCSREKCPRDLHRGDDAPQSSSGSLCTDWRRLSRCGLRADLDACRSADDAQGALSDHAPLYAQSRRLWPGDDVPHLYGTGQFRLRLRIRHGEEIARCARAATGRHRVICQFAVPRRPDQRVLILSQSDLDRCR